MQTPAPAPDWMMELFRALQYKKTYIGQLELVAAVVAYLTFPDILAGTLCHHFIDNEGAYYSLMSGYSGKADCALVIHEYHLQILRLKCYPWLGFVYSGDNISDLPSRNEFGLVQRLGATFRTAVMPNLVGWDQAVV